MIKVFFLLLFCFLFTNLYAQWSADQRLTSIQGYSFSPQAACWGDTVHLVWWEGYTNPLIHEEVFYKRSLDGGETWESDTMLSPEDNISCVIPHIDVWRDNVHVLWYEHGTGRYVLCYKKSTDAGNSWHMTDTLRRENTGGWGSGGIAVKDSNVYVVYVYEDRTLNFTKSTDNGTTWSNHQVIGNGGAFACINVFSNCDSSLVACVNNTIFTREVYCYLSTDRGATWSDSIVISHYDSIASQIPKMTTDGGGGIHITWYDYKYSPYASTGDIFYRTSRDSGNSWEEIDSLTVAHRAHACDILAEVNNLHLAWMDDRHDFGHNFEIYYRMSSNLGQTWEQEVRLTDAIGHSETPALTCDSQYLHLFWSDYRDDPGHIFGEIYYKRKDLVGVHEDGQLSEFSKSMLEVFPNPAHKDLHVKYTLFQHTKANLSIYDVAGRLVSTLANSQHEPGLHRQTFKTGNLSQGVYFVRLCTIDKSIVEKVIFLK